MSYPIDYDEQSQNFIIIYYYYYYFINFVVNWKSHDSWASKQAKIIFLLYIIL
jgi:hypothetical protein